MLKILWHPNLTLEFKVSKRGDVLKSPVLQSQLDPRWEGTQRVRSDHSASHI